MTLAEALGRRAIGIFAGGDMITRRQMLAATGGLTALAAAGRAAAQERTGNMVITRSGSQPSKRFGRLFHRFGADRSPFRASAPARIGGGIVTFEPGARTGWHTHPLGQTLFVTSGTGWVQRERGPKEEVRAATWCGFLLARSIGMAPRPPLR